MKRLFNSGIAYPVMQKQTWHTCLLIKPKAAAILCLLGKSNLVLGGMVIFILSCSNSFGQIPNSGFENWTYTGSYWEPDGWWTANDSISSGNFYPVTRSGDHFPATVGNYSMRLENNLSLLPAWGGYGITWTGDFSGSNNPVFPITGHPASLWGYFKFMPQNNDTMEIHIRLYQNGVDISGGYFKNAGPVTAWTPFNLPFSAYSGADSARIMILACYDNDAPIPHGNSVLYIDNLSFDSLITAGIPEPNAGSEMSVHYNPYSHMIGIDVPAPIGKMQTTIITDLTGKVVFKRTSSATENAEVNAINFSEGVYLVRVQAKDFVETKKVMISK